MKLNYKLLLASIAIAFAGNVFAQGDIPNAEVGKCYAKCVIPAVYTTEIIAIQTKAPSTKIVSSPAVYKTVTEKVLATAASSKLVTSSAVYKTVTEKILVKEASTKLVAVPATYGTESEKVVSVEASTKITTKSAIYGTESERIMTSPEKSKWVKSKTPGCLSPNPNDCVVWCLKTVPAQYKTVSKRVLRTPASSNTINIPAQYKTITRRVVKTPATTRTINVPAEYKTITKRMLVTPASSSKIDIPATYKTITRRVLVTAASSKTIQIPGQSKEVSKQVLSKKGGHTEWKEVLCSTGSNYNATITKIQKALLAKGYDIGPAGVDNILGKDTRAALLKYQKDNNLPQGNLNKETLRHLGVE